MCEHWLFSPWKGSPDTIGQDHAATGCSALRRRRRRRHSVCGSRWHRESGRDMGVGMAVADTQPGLVVVAEERRGRGSGT